MRRMEIFRTPEARFADLPGYPFAPHWLDWNGLRIHYLDEGPPNAPPVLLLHGEPTWSYLYRKMIPPLVAAGYRCIAPDYAGFGKSDKPTHDAWYVIARHVETVAALIARLDLRGVTLVCQDWGGPIGLLNAAAEPGRYARLFVLNTWLHHDEFVYGPGIRAWRANAVDPARLGGDMPCGRIVARSLARPNQDLESVARAYDAPFVGVESKAGVRRFPWCIPFAQPLEGLAAEQARAIRVIDRFPAPVHFAFGDADPVFSFDWAERWAKRTPGSTLDRIAGASHFVQEEAGEELAGILLRRARA
jgi:haloalkane dehalogenase